LSTLCNSQANLIAKPSSFDSPGRYNESGLVAVKRLERAMV
jgi:hypothetical protein